MGLGLTTQNGHGTITINLLQGSPSNHILDLFLQNDIEPSRVGYFPLLIIDRNGPLNGAPAWRCKAGTCWVAEFPNWSLHNDVQTRTWTLETNNIQYNTLAPYPDLGETAGAQRATPLDV